MRYEAVTPQTTTEYIDDMAIHTSSNKALTKQKKNKKNSHKRNINSAVIAPATLYPFLIPPQTAAALSGRLQADGRPTWTRVVSAEAKGLGLAGPLGGRC